MTIKIGDKVKFLNDVGGGIVSGFKNKEIVFVQDEDGFEIPVLITECVITESSKSAAAVSSENKPVAQQAEKEVPTEFRDKKDFKAFIAITPEFHDAPLQGQLEMYLINDSNYFLYYLCETNATDSQSIADGLLLPNTHQPLGTYTAQELGDLSKINVRILPFARKKGYKQLQTIEKTVAFNAVKLSKSKSYEDTAYLKSKTHLIPLHKDIVEESIKDLKEIPQGKHQNDKSRLKSPRKVIDLIEVDLHIEALLDDFSGMSKGEILEYQINKFKATIDENRGRKGQRIVFIHGVGNGRLKNDIRNSLQRKYKLDFQDASFREYGYGATMVIIR